MDDKSVANNLAKKFELSGDFELTVFKLTVPDLYNHSWLRSLMVMVPGVRRLNNVAIQTCVEWEIFQMSNRHTLLIP